MDDIRSGRELKIDRVEYAERPVVEAREMMEPGNRE
jgi:hypothetical protein